MADITEIILNGTTYELASDSGGISSVAQALLINILRNGIYETDQSTNITNLETELASGGGGSTTVAIINTLTNCTSNNSASSISVGSSYMATITANTGYDITTATVTMGGVDVTTAVYSAGVITIPNVTGTLVITVTAESEAETGLVHYWDLTSGSLVDTIDGETALTLSGSASITSNVGVSISNANGSVVVPFTNPSLVRAKIVFGNINQLSGDNQTLLGLMAGSTSTPAVALRYSQNDGVWETSTDVSTGITDSDAFANKELIIVRPSSDARKVNVLFNDEVIVNGYSGGVIYNYLSIGGSFYNFEIKSIKVYES